MTIKHTPGPWTVSSRGSYTHVIAPPTKDYPVGHVVAAISAGPGKCTRENAALISSAPDLLAAAHHAVAVLTDPAATDAHKINEVVNALSDAIAKAEGTA